MNPVRIAISIKQPWATLVVHGLKRIEVRKWSTKRTGSVYIHAGRRPDARDEAWRLVPSHLIEQAELRGGLVGRILLNGCRTYSAEQEFAADASLHCNQPEWFVPPRMYGFELCSPKPIPFEPIRGKLYFFEVRR